MRRIILFCFLWSFCSLFAKNKLTERLLEDLKNLKVSPNNVRAGDLYKKIEAGNLIIYDVQDTLCLSKSTTKYLLDSLSLAVHLVNRGQKKNYEVIYLDSLHKNVKIKSGTLTGNFWLLSDIVEQTNSQVYYGPCSDKFLFWDIYIWVLVVIKYSKKTENVSFYHVKTVIFTQNALLGSFLKWDFVSNFIVEMIREVIFDITEFAKNYYKKEYIEK